MTTALEGGEWSAACPGRTLPPGKTQYPLYRRLGGPQGQSGQAENLVPTRIQSPTVQPVARSLYWLSYPAHTCKYSLIIYIQREATKPTTYLTQTTTFIQWPYIYKNLLHTSIHQYTIISVPKMVTGKNLRFCGPYLYGQLTNLQGLEEMGCLNSWHDAVWNHNKKYQALFTYLYWCKRPNRTHPHAGIQNQAKCNVIYNKKY